LQGNPVRSSATWPDGRLLPMLVAIDLQADGTHDWPQLIVPLRVNPASASLSRTQMRSGSVR
jgi:hypothetical protein